MWTTIRLKMAMAISAESITKDHSEFAASRAPPLYVNLIARQTEILFY